MRAVFLRILLGGGCFLAGIFTFTLLPGDNVSLFSLERLLNTQFEEVTEEASALIEYFPELGEKNTLIARISGHDSIFYMEAKVAQFWITPSQWEQWQKPHRRCLYRITHITLEGMHPFMRDVVQEFLPADTSYFYWRYEFKSGWAISLISPLNNIDRRLIPVLAVFHRPGSRY